MLNQSRLYGYIYSLVHDMDVADDIYQQAAMIGWRKFDSYQSETNFGAWICRIAQFELLNYRQKAGRERVVFSDQLVELLSEKAAERESPIATERRAALATCVSDLRPVDRDLLEATYVRNEKAEAIAEQTGRSTAGIYNALSRIRTALLECVKRVLAREDRT